MSLYELFGTIEVGLVFGLVALGAYLSFKTLAFPDLTVEGSFPLGAAVAVMLIVGGGVNPWLATLVAGVAGYFAGYLTALLNVRFGILNILAGILVSIALYSVNLRIMEGPNKPLLGSKTIFSDLPGFGLPTYMVSPILLLIIVIAIKLLLDQFMRTGIGLSMRAAGANPAMAAANGVDVAKMNLLGLGIANLLTALAGAIFAQLFGAADVYMGVGVVIVGLASVIVGTSILPSRTVEMALFACLIGAIAYRAAVAIALNTDFLGLQTADVQLVTAVLVVIALVLQNRGGLRRLVQRGRNA
ncbi:MAG: ABC transporter permease [Pseudorhodoplanes sp.]|uniref:ABC transporter permease n=1 Tax=Pseudorhodoplanes sp. TaxID=1934341 RepID=UPI003D14B1F0